MRVLFLGTTGLGKSDVLNQVADIACKEKYELSTGIQHESASKYVQIFDIDNRIRKNLNLGYSSFMDDNVREKQIDIWKQELEKILTEVEQTQSKNIFLSAHAVYYRYNNYFSMIDQNTLSKFCPDMIITLIDDIYDVSKKVTEKEKEFHTNSSCTLSEALGWRTVETLMADNLSENLLQNKTIPHYVLAIKHNVRTFYRLIFEKERLILYSSFPITSTRTDINRTKEINNFKVKLEEKYIILDPATIDEILIKTKSSMKSEEYEYLQQNKMIHAENDNAVILKRLCGNYSRSTELPESLTIDQFENIQDVISKQVEKRDYRMVHQSEGVVGYRPFWGDRGDPSGGVDQELKWALSLHKGAIVYHPDEDGDPKLMFTGIEDAQKYNSIDELFSQLEAMQKIKNSSL